MKSRTSFCNKTILKNDLLRYAPIWVLYTLGLLICHLMANSQSFADWRGPSYLSDFTKLAAVANGLYALVVSQALFGELFTARSCNAVHALPVTRDTLFITHTISGFLFSFVPNLVVTLIMLPQWGAGADGGLWLLLCACLTYTFYFGSALFAIQLAGNRIGAVLIYGIINFAAVLVAWFGRYLYDILIYGISLDMESIINFCPSFAFLNSRVLSLEYADAYAVGNTAKDPYSLVFQRFVLCPSDLLVIVAWAAVGIVLLLLALVLYRRRKLETAGDLLAIPGLNPVFRVLFAFTVGGFFHLFSTSVVSDGFIWTAILGIIVGWFIGQMLIERKLNVFSVRGTIPLVVILAVLLGSMLLTALDVAHIARRIPDPDQIASISLYPQYQNWHRFTSDDPEDIQALRDAHQALTEDAVPHALNILLHNARQADVHGGETIATVFEYTLKDGSTFSRTYSLGEDSIVNQTIGRYYQKPEVVLGVPKEDLATLSQHIKFIEQIEFNPENQIYGRARYLRHDYQGLMDALIADCNDGNITPQFYWFYRPEGDRLWCSLSIIYEDGYLDQDIYRTNSINVTITSGAARTTQWLREHENLLEMGQGMG